MNRRIWAAAPLVALACGSTPRGPAAPQHGARNQEAPAATMAAMTPAHPHGAAAPAVTYAELQRTAEQLAAAREATARYQDVRAAEAAGYRSVGPHLPGMGTHYVRGGRSPEFSVTEPPILLYERDSTVSTGMRLVGVSYLFVAASDPDGQPEDAPFPKALASWHKHNNVCVLPDNSASVDFTEAQCQDRGGRFTAETSWMIHAWIWKESPAGVFSPVNPLVK